MPQKCFVDFPSARGRVDNGWTCPLTQLCSGFWTVAWINHELGPCRARCICPAVAFSRRNPPSVYYPIVSPVCFSTVTDGVGDISDGADLCAGCSGSPHLYFSHQTVSLWTQQDPVLHPGVSPKTEGLTVQRMDFTFLWINNTIEAKCAHAEWFRDQWRREPREFCICGRYRCFIRRFTVGTQDKVINNIQHLTRYAQQ